MHPIKLMHINRVQFSFFTFLYLMKNLSPFAVETQNSHDSQSVLLLSALETVNDLITR